jgi:glutamyl-tRNA reductase
MKTVPPALNLYCLGINHRTAPIEVREKLWFSNDEVRSLLAELNGEITKECSLISTCNRTELYYVPQDSSADWHSVWMMLAAAKHINEIVTGEEVYALHSLNVVKHLFKLASGIDSMVLGDVQILGQIKTGYALARESRTAGSILNKLFTNALHVGKRARAETEIGDGAVSVGYAAAELASKIFRDLSTKTALLIGAGETGELTAKHLHGHHLGRLLITNRTRERAEALGARLGGTVIDFESLRLYLPEVDIIVTSVAAPEPVLRKEDLQDAMNQRGRNPLFIIDLGVPRNVDPGSAAIANTFLHDIDSLNHIVDKNLERRTRELPKVNRIVLDELAGFQDWHDSLQITPTIQQLRESFEHIRQMEFEKYHHHFSPELQEEISILTKRIVNKILHAPMVNLRSESVRSESDKYVSILRSIFGLDMEKDIV